MTLMPEPNPASDRIPTTSRSGSAARSRCIRRGPRVGLCDLTAGELGSNGTPEERLAEAEAARVLGAAWRENLGWPDGGISGDDQVRRRRRADSPRRPRAVAMPYWDDRHPDHVAPAGC